MFTSPPRGKNSSELQGCGLDSCDIDIRISCSDALGTDTEDHEAELGKVSQENLGPYGYEQTFLGHDDKSPEELFRTLSEEELVELEILRDQEIDTMFEQGLLPQGDRWETEHRNKLCFSYPEMLLEIMTGDRYPLRPLTYQIINKNLPRVVIDPLRVVLREIHKIDSQANSTIKWHEREWSDSGYFEAEMAALHIVSECMAHLKQFRSDPSYRAANATALRKTDHALSFERRVLLRQRYGLDDDVLGPDWSKKVTDLTAEQKLALTDVQHQCEVKDSMWGIDPASVSGHGLANAVLEKTPEQICAEVPEHFRILHIESVVRSDLVANFRRRQDIIRKDLEKLPLNILRGSLKRKTRMELGKRAKEQDTLIDHLIAPELTFHCTRDSLISSIVRQGFLMPEFEKDIRCGATYGQGIYSSPDPLFSLMYTDFRFEPTKFDEFAGLKLIACATITGIARYMTRDDGWREHNTVYPGAHCHVANDLMEYVVFDEAQIIPCYVIHLDLGRDAARFIANLSKNPIQYINGYHQQQSRRKHVGVTVMGPGDLQRHKQALLAKAQKYFPYGYGAASGSKFVVEDVAEVSEDEEEYGVYQKDRLDDDGKPARDIWTMDDHATLALDAGWGSGDEDGEEKMDNNRDGDEDSKKDAGRHGDEDGDEEKVDWEYEMGPEGRTKFDEFYEARKAKVKKRGRVGR